jgi:phage gp29-like protein
MKVAPPRREDLTEEIATPTIAGLRPIWSEHPSVGLTPWTLAEILLDAERGDTARFLELAEDMEEKDLHYRSVLQTRKLAVAQLEVTVEPAGPSKDEQRAAGLINDILQRDELQDELVDLLDGLGKGYSVVEIIWDVAGKLWAPARLEWRDPRWFVFDQRDGRTLRLRGGPGETGAAPADDGSLQPGTVALPPFKFITHKPKTKSGLPIRAGLARAAAWTYLFKNWDLKDWVSFVAVYGQPFRLGKYDANATPADKAVLLKAVRNISADAAAIIPRTMDVEFIRGIEGKGGGGEAFQQLASFLDQQVSKAVLGQTATTDAIAGGHAVGREHNDVRTDIQMSDARQIAGTLNRDLVRPAIDLNMGPQERYPRIRLGQSEVVNPDTFTLAVDRVVRLGGKVGQGFVRSKLGIPDPEDGEDLLAAAATAPKTGPGKPGPAGPGGDEGEPDADDAPEEDLEEDEAAHAARTDGDHDAVDAFLGALLGGDRWEPLVAPLMDPISDAVEKAATPDELKERLVGLIGAMDSARLQGALTRAGFFAHVAGTAGAGLSGGDGGGSGGGGGDKTR